MAADAAIERLIDDLYARAPENRIEPRLDASRRVLDLLGDPQRSYRIIHITGTNGKSSTARIAASILAAMGLRVGIFTSPHLVRFNERIVIDGEPISDEALLATWADIEPYVAMVDRELAAEGKHPLTFFEALTVLAFAAYADAPVDVLCLEVGMGGEWDATNVADGDVAVFAPIDLDHTRVLGSTVGEIAHTKAGIIKPGAIAVTAVQPPDALAEIEEKAAALHVPVKRENRDFEVLADRRGVGGQMMTVAGLAGRYSDLLLPLIGDHQAHNAALAIAAVEALVGGGERAIGDDVIREGVGNATSPGRLQLVEHDPSVVIDAAHNPHGARSLAAALRDYFRFGYAVGVLGILSDKDVLGILDALSASFDDVVVTASHSPRAIPADDLAAAAVRVFGAEHVIVADELEDALDEARHLVETHAAEADPIGVVDDDAVQDVTSTGLPGIVVAGSITLIGEVAALEERGR